MKKSFLSFFLILIILGKSYGQSSNLEENRDYLNDMEDARTLSWLEQKEAEFDETFKKSDLNVFNRRLAFNQKPSEIKSVVYTITIRTYSDIPPVILSKKHHQEEVSQTLVKLTSLKKSENDFPFIENLWISDSNGLAILAVSHSSSDWLEFLVYDLNTREYLYSLEGIISPWIELNRAGFFYEAFDVPDDKIKGTRQNQHIAFHSFHTPQHNDRLIFQNPDKSAVRSFDVFKSRVSDYLFIFHAFQSGNQWLDAITAININDPNNPKTILTYNSPNPITFDYIMESDDEVYFRTNLMNPTNEVMKFSLNASNKYESVIPSFSQVLLEARNLGNGLLGLKYLDNGKFSAAIMNMKAESLAYFPAPDGSGVDIYPGNNLQYAYMDVTHFCLPTQTYKIDLQNEMNVEFHSGQSIESYEDFIVELTSYKNKEGKDIPVYLAYEKRKMKRNGNNTALIKVYGGYGQIIEPSFSWWNYYFIKNGGILVVPAIRGGGELGSVWSLNGRGKYKTNALDDVVSVAEFLIEEKLSTAESIVIEGTSHGGFLAAASALYRPDLFGAVIANAGVYDLNESVSESVGYDRINRIEFGDPDDPASAVTRDKVSPMNMLKPNTDYPSFLLITGSNDSRVPPSQTYRFMAKLEDYSTNPGNYLFVTNGGHSIATYPDEILNLWSLKFKFIYELTGEKFWH